VGDVLPLVAVFAAFAVVMFLLARSTRRRRGRRIASSVAGPFEEIWHPAAHRARIQIEIQDERKIAMPSPDDPLHPGQDDPGKKSSQPESS
jgi:hypothetical protein